MQAENLVLDKGSKREIVKEIGEVFPDVSIAVFTETFVVEAVDLSNLAGLVVAAEDGDAMGVADFQGDKEGNGFDGEVATVNVVACRIWLT